LRKPIALILLLAAACRYAPPDAQQRPSPDSTDLRSSDRLAPPVQEQYAVSEPGDHGLPPGRDVSIEPNPLRVGGDVKPPTVIKRVPPLSGSCGGAPVSGPIIVELVIDEHGLTRDVQVLRPKDPCLQKALIAALKQWEFRPGTLNGKPISVIFSLSAPIRPSR